MMKKALFILLIFPLVLCMSCNKKVFISGVQINSASYVVQGNTLTTKLLSDNDITYTKVE